MPGRALLGRLLRRAGLRHSAATLPAIRADADARLLGEVRGDLPGNLFVNPIAEGADPFVVRDGRRYLWCQSEGNVAIALWETGRLHAFGRRHVVWTAPSTGACSAQVWAPELIQLDGRWHIYFAASDGDNRNHRSYVLVAQTDDPLGPYELRGPLFTGDGPGGANLWSIDLTVLEHAGERYALWSGWPDESQDVQHLYLSAMVSPSELTGPRVRIAEAGRYLWERTHETPESRGLLEGPQALSRGGRTFVVYSCAASWLATYKLGMLELTGDDPLDPLAWTRSPAPVFESTESTYGVGHGSFTQSPDDREWWHVFHAKVDRSDGWRRGVHVQPMSWNDDGSPLLGVPSPARQPIQVPSGTVVSARTASCSWDLTQPDTLDDFDYYGHHQMLAKRSDGAHLGLVPRSPVNAYRSGEKLVLRDGRYGDLRLTASFRFAGGHRAAGVLFRCTAAGVGYDAQRGYFAGVALHRAALVLGTTNGAEFRSLAETPLDVARPDTFSLTVTAHGDHLRVTSGSATLDVYDDGWTTGSVGLRVVDTHTCFPGLSIEALG